MKRRHFIAQAAGMIGFSSISHAKQEDTVGPIDSMKPYVQVSPLKEDLDVVRVYFTPECSFSRAYLPFFANLKKTLPKERIFVYSDLVNRRDGPAYALACAAVRRNFPAYMSNFVEASMIGVQDKGMVLRSWAAIDRIGRAAQIPKPLSQVVWEQKKELQADVISAVNMQSHYKVTNTPSVAVAGTYIVNPEVAMGDMEMFSNLLNAVISMSR